MIRKIFKWIAYGLLVIVLVVTGLFTKAYWSVEKRLTKKYDITLQPFTLTTDSSIVAEGRRIAQTKDCSGCHGADMGGKVWLDNPLLGKIVAPNLTKGEGGLSEIYSTNDWLRALKHGVKSDLTALRIMPSHELAQLTTDDMNALIAYCSQLPSVDRTLSTSTLGVAGYILADFDQIPLIAAEKIDHTLPLRESILQEESIEFGKYLSVSCEGCHRKNMKGGAPVAPGFPEVADITSSGNPGKWTVAQFMTTLQTGKTPEGKQLKPEEMPWTAYKNYTKTEFKALFKYLKSI
ncbi:MAG TPA: cytochrome c [Cyclobacteriaceae bacterium]